MRGRDHPGEFEQLVLWASIGAIYAPSTMILGIFFAAPMCSPLSLLFVPRAPQLQVVAPLTSFLVSLSISVFATVLARA